MENFEKNPVRSFLSVVVLGTLALELITVIVFLIIGRFSMGVVIGALWGTAVMAVYYFLMARTVTKAAAMDDPDAAKKRVQASYSMRMLFLLAAMGAGLYMATSLELMNWIPMLLAVIYPRISIAAWQIANRKKLMADDSTSSKEGE